jgi:hypothetical protein
MVRPSWYEAYAPSEAVKKLVGRFALAVAGKAEQIAVAESLVRQLDQSRP